MINKVFYTFLAFISVVLFFLPFYLITPQGNQTEELSIIKKVNPEDFNPEIGIEGGILNRALSGDAKTFNPAMAEETTSTAVIGDLFETS
jgi:peptide/nickel transport system substrate-binding protein